MVDFAKNNPIIAIASVLSAVGIIVGSVLTVDSRYAHADDLEREKQTAAKQIKDQTQVLKQETIKLRQQIVEDKVFELDMKREQAPNQRLSPVDEAQYKRYSRQLEDLNRALTAQ